MVAVTGITRGHSFTFLNTCQLQVAYLIGGINIHSNTLTYTITLEK